MARLTKSTKKRPKSDSEDDYDDDGDEDYQEEKDEEEMEEEEEIVEAKKARRSKTTATATSSTRQSVTTTTTTSSSSSSFATSSRSVTLPLSKADQRIQNRKAAFKAVAETRAEHFARSESSTTPTGSLRKKSRTDTGEAKEGEDEEEVWPGPFTTAAMIIQKRDAARKAREEKLKAAVENGSLTILGEDDNSQDVYEKELSNFQWSGSLLTNTSKANNSNSNSNSSTIIPYQEIPSLNDLCCRKIAKLLQEEAELGEGGGEGEVEGNSSFLDCLSNEQKEKIAEYLAKARFLNSTTALKLSSPNNNMISLPDCSQIEEEAMLKIIEKVCYSSSPTSKEDEEVVHHSNASLHYLLLKNCGRCFTDRIAALLVNAVEHLEILQVNGCYRLSDDGINKLLGGCQSILKRLIITSNPRISQKSLSYLVTSLSHLQYLSLDFSSHLKDDDLNILVKEDNSSSSSSSSRGSLLPALEELSLQGLSEVSSGIFVRIIEYYGKRLKYLNLSGCTKGVNDLVVIAIRDHCKLLTSLLLENIDDVSPTAWVGLFIPDQTHLKFSSPAISDPLLVSSTSTSTSTSRSNRSGVIGPLEKISFQGTSNITDEVIIQLTEHYGRSLIDLNVNGCNLLTNRSLAALWLHCSENLQVLDLSFIRNMTEVALGYLLEKSHRMKKLSIWGCSQLTSRFYYWIESCYELNSRIKIIGKISL